MKKAAYPMTQNETPDVSLGLWDGRSTSDYRHDGQQDGTRTGGSGSGQIRATPSKGENYHGDIRYHDDDDDHTGGFRAEFGLGAYQSFSLPSRSQAHAHVHYDHKPSWSPNTSQDFLDSGPPPPRRLDKHFPAIQPILSPSTPRMLGRSNSRRSSFAVGGDEREGVLLKGPEERSGTRPGDLKAHPIHIRNENEGEDGGQDIDDDDQESGGLGYRYHDNDSDDDNGHVHNDTNQISIDMKDQPNSIAFAVIHSEMDRIQSLPFSARNHSRIGHRVTPPGFPPDLDLPTLHAIRSLRSATIGSDQGYSEADEFEGAFESTVSSQLAGLQDQITELKELVVLLAAGKGISGQNSNITEDVLPKMDMEGTEVRHVLDDRITSSALSIADHRTEPHQNGGLENGGVENNDMDVENNDMDFPPSFLQVSKCILFSGKTVIEDCPSLTCCLSSPLPECSMCRRLFVFPQHLPRSLRLIQKLDKIVHANTSPSTKTSDEIRTSKRTDADIFQESNLIHLERKIQRWAEVRGRHGSAREEGGNGAGGGGVR